MNLYDIEVVRRDDTTLKMSDTNNHESIYDKGNYDVSGGLDEL